MKPAAISAQKLAQLLGVSRPTVYARIKAGQIREIRFGKRRLIPVSEAERVTGLPYHPDWVDPRS